MSLNAKSKAVEGESSVKKFEKKAPRADGREELQVWSIPLNQRLLICHAPEADGSNPMNLVSVIVADNSRFIKKMRLLARPVKDRQFTLEGPLPRWRGRW